MFERVDRQQAEDVVLVPGWGFDRRIFARLDLPYNYLCYVGPSAAGFGGALEGWLAERGVGACSILGWSIGAFAASAFACERAWRVRHLILLGARRAYAPAALAQLETGLRRNKRAVLLRLYRASFRGHDASLYQWFKETLMADYLADMSAERLSADLAWLGRTHIEGGDLARVTKVTLVHGRQDEVAPVSEAQALARSCPSARCVLLDPCGHLPFLHPGFSRCIDDC